MAKTRLNNADREHIADAIIARKFAPLQIAAAQDEFALAARLYERLYSAEVRKKMWALPEGAFADEDDLKIAVNGKRHRLYFGPYYGGYIGRTHDDKKNTMPVFAKHQGYEPGLSVTDADELGAAIDANAVLRMDLRDQRSDMRRKLLATLSSFNTFDDLVSKFPEAEAFIMERWRERPEGGSPSVPAVVIADLARALDLPPELRKAA